LFLYCMFYWNSLPTFKFSENEEYNQLSFLIPLAVTRPSMHKIAIIIISRSPQYTQASWIQLHPLQSILSLTFYIYTSLTHFTTCVPFFSSFLHIYITCTRTHTIVDSLVHPIFSSRKPHTVFLPLYPSFSS